MQGDVFGLLGATIEGRYRIDSLVGEGGFGVVYRGQHLSLQHPIAIKCLKTPPGFSPQAREAFFSKFREEGQMLSRLRECPGVVHVYDHGATNTRLGPAPYLVLEWLEGQTLEAYLAQRRNQGQGLLSLAEAVALLAPAFDALAFAHRMKIAHRDIKPANLFLATTVRGTSVKILDFGIAKAMQEGDNAQQAATGVGGGFQAFSPLYGAPEQFFSRRYGASGPWTDVHAMALVLVEALTGRAALQGSEMAELLTSATAAERPTPRARGLWVPEPVEAVFSRALAIDTTVRFADAEQLYEALRQAMHASGLPVPGPLPSLAAPYGYSPVATPAQPLPLPAQAVAPVPAAVGVWRQPSATYGVPQPATDYAPPATDYAPPLAAAQGAHPGWPPQPQGPAAPQGAAGHPGATGQGHPGAGAQSQPGAGVQSYPGAGVQGYPGAGVQGYPGATALPPGATAPRSAGTEVPAWRGTEVPAGYTAAATASGGVGQGPVAGVGPPAVPQPPPGRRASRGPAVAAAVGALVLLGATAAVGALLWSRLGDGGGARPSASGSAALVPAGETVEYARNVVLGRDVFAVGPLKESERAGWYHAISRQGGRAVRVQKMRPNGMIGEETQISLELDGRTKIVVLNSHQDEVSRVVRERDGTEARTLRSGEVSDEGCSRVRVTFSAAGDVAERLCLSPTNLPVTDSEGCQLWRYTHDERHLRQSAACFLVEEGREPRPSENKEGVHLQKFQHDAAGFLVTARFFDATGASASRSSDGCAGVQLGHDGVGNTTTTTCLDSTGTPRPWKGHQVATTRVDFDGNGCPVRQSYLDVTGAPTKKGEIAVMQLAVGPRCDVLRTSLHGLSGAPAQDPAQGEFSSLTSFEIDGHGDPMAQRCQDSRMQPVNCQGGSGGAGALVRWQRDARGRPVTQKGFFADGRPSAIYQGSYPHEERLSYGDDGRLASQTFFDERGAPATALGPVGRIASRYDAMGGLVSETFFGSNGRPVESLIGCHEVRYAFDARHRLEAVECRGTGGALRAHQNWSNRGIAWPAGAARMVVERGETLANVYSGPEGRPVKRVECKKIEQLCYR